MIGIFDFYIVLWIIIGLLLIILGLKNFKSSKDNFYGRYLRVGNGIVFMLYALLRLFFNTNLWLGVILCVGINIIVGGLTYIKHKRHVG